MVHRMHQPQHVSRDFLCSIANLYDVSQAIKTAPGGSIFMVAAHVVGQESLQVLRIERDHMIEQISSIASQPAVGDTVLPRAPE